MMPGETVEAEGSGGTLPLLKPPQQMNGCPTIPSLLTIPGGGYGKCIAPLGHIRAQEADNCHTDRDLRWAAGVAGTCNGVTGFNFVTENFCTNGVEECHDDGSARRLPVLQVGGKGPNQPNCGRNYSPASHSTMEGETRWVGVAEALEGRVIKLALEGGPEMGAGCATTEETHAASSPECSTSEASDSELSLPDHPRICLEDPCYLPGHTWSDQTHLSDTLGHTWSDQTHLSDLPGHTWSDQTHLSDTLGHTWSDQTHLSDTPLFQEEYYQDDDVLIKPAELDCVDHSQYNLHGATFNIKESSQVHIGPYYGPIQSSITGANMTPTPPDRLDHLWVEKSPKKGHGTLKVNLAAAPMQQLHPDLRQHSPLLQTQSAPETTLTPPVVGGRPGVRLLTQQPLLNAPPTPQTPIGTFTIAGDGSVVIGTQIIYNNPSCKKHPLDTTTPPPTSNTSPTTTSNHQQKEEELEALLAEVRDKLSTVYIRQTKTSFLPWLKGHQVIPMTEFYTDSRILAVDKQGRQTNQCVNLVRDLVHEEETRFLVEGEPGMGKTLLALKLAIDWAKKNSLQEFKFVFLIFLRDFKGSLEQYVREELLPSHFEDKLKQVWEYCKKHEEQVLFILDGYDELEKADAGEIHKLLSNRDFQNSKVVVTARPDVLKTIAQRTIVKGFNEAQMFEFVTKYFKLVNEEECGRNLKRIIEKDYKYRKLAKRPLFCVLLCMLYGSDGVAKLPEKLTDMMFKIMLCLIKWNKKVGNVDENTEDFPAEYEELFLSFGKLCLQALKTEKTRFSEKEIKGIENYSKLLHLGFLSNDSENDVLGYKKFYKPVHKIFLEYLAGLYMAGHIERDRSDCRECREFSKVYRHEHVLKFVVGILGKKAHLALDGRKHQVFLQMKDQELLMLLRETEPTRENCRAVAKLLDRRNAIVYTSEVDFEGWSSILAQNFKKLNSLEIVWRIKSTNPDQESSFNEATPQLYAAFFNALRSNTSITKISIRATQDGEPFSDEKIELFFSHLQGILVKENLHELEIKELKMKVSTHLRKAIEGATCHMEKKAMETLEILRLDMEILDDDLAVLCRRLGRYAPNLTELQLTGLVHGAAGFESLVHLLKKNKNLHKLCISMNKAKLMDESKLFMTKVALSPSDLHTGQVQMKSNATKNSRDAYNRQDPEQRSQRAGRLLDPTRELHYLFQDPLHTGAKHKYEARGYFFINGAGESRLPLPLCLAGGQHQSMFHTLFSALPDTGVRSLALDYPCLYLNTADLVCLGHALRKARNLTSLRLLGLKKAEDYMPVLLGLGQSQSLTTVKLDSHNVVITDTAFQLACTSLRNNTTLRSLSLAHWEFNLQDKSLSIAYLKDLLSSWKVLDLNLSSCIVDVGVGMPTSPTLFPPILLPINAPIQHWSTIKTLRMSEVKLKEQPGFIRRSHLLLPLLRNCPNLTSLDLSSSHTQATTLDDNSACKFFELLGTNFRKLRDLNLGNWEFRFEHYEKTCAQIGNTVRSCGELRMLMLDKVCEVRSGLSHLPPCRTTFLHQLVSNLPRLAELSLCYYRIDNEELDRDTATRLGACFHDHWSSGTKFKLKFFGLSPGVETSLHEALKKEGVSVVVSQGYPLVFTVKRGYFLRT